MKSILLSFLIITYSLSFGQTAWTWEVLDSMPERVANNAVAYGEDGANHYVFSFGGINSTKIHSGINKRAFRYTIETDSWEEIDTLPFSLSNIASGASTVDNIIYVIGGYHVYAGGGEISSNEVIRYDPMTNTYLTNGAEIPVPIDDHVQCVWRDSLIFVVTGWSNTGNVPDVQIYNPELDSWSVGTPTPNTNDYKAFGPSGEIIGDTIYYYGGASMGINFPARKILRKGVIDAEDPTNITWTLLEDGPNTLYRSAALTYGNNVFWAGGSSVSYNYNGIAYNGSGGVSPLTQIMRYDHSTDTWYAGEGAPYGVMDLRGIAQISPTQWIICGGMEEDQYVSRQTYLLTYDPVVGAIAESQNDYSIKVQENLIYLSHPAEEIFLFDFSGKLVAQIDTKTPQLPDNLSGGYLLMVNFGEVSVTKKVVCGQ